MRGWGELCIIIVYGGAYHLLKDPKISHPKTSSYIGITLIPITPLS